MLYSIGTPGNLRLQPGRTKCFKELVLGLLPPTHTGPAPVWLLQQQELRWCSFHSATLCSHTWTITAHTQFLLAYFSARSSLPYSDWNSISTSLALKLPSFLSLFVHAKRNASNLEYSRHIWFKVNYRVKNAWPEDTRPSVRMLLSVVYLVWAFNCTIVSWVITPVSYIRPPVYIVLHEVVEFLPDFDIVWQKPPVDGFGGMGHESASFEAGLL